MGTPQNFSTALAKITDTFAPMIERQLTGNGVNMDGYAKQCVVNAISSINAVLDSKGIEWMDPQLDRNGLTQILLTIASLKLNAAASPREVFFQVRNVKVKKKEDGRDVDVWKKQIEMGIEGDGNDAILARFGRDVKKVAPYWLVREGDVFEYPVFNGLSYHPPKWQPTGKGDVVRVVYPIIQNDDTIQFYIAERNDVAKNLIAHINNNLMNETFGICQDRFKATADQKVQIARKKAEVLKKAKELGLDSLDDAELMQWISPAWTEYHSREAMIIRKMRNNVTKKIPKDFGSAFVEMIHSEATDDTYTIVRQEIAENANSEPIDLDSRPTQAETSEPVPPQQETRKEPVVEKQTRANEVEQAVFDFEQQYAAAGPGF